MSHKTCDDYLNLSLQVKLGILSAVNQIIAVKVSFFPIDVIIAIVSSLDPSRDATMFVVFSLALHPLLILHAPIKTSLRFPLWAFYVRLAWQKKTPLCWHFV